MPLFTIGYGSRPLDDFISLLQQHEIAFLLDVRSAPYSRYKPEFGKDALDAALKSCGIRYVFMGDTLGGRPDDPALHDADGLVDYEKLRQSDPYRRGIERLHTAHEQGHRVALMCAEGKPEQCHRSRLIGATLADDGLDVTHIDEQGELRPQAEVMARLAKEQHGDQLGLLDGTPSPQRSFADNEAGEAPSPPGGKGFGDGVGRADHLSNLDDPNLAFAATEFGDFDGDYGDLFDSEFGDATPTTNSPVTDVLPQIEPQPVTLDGARALLKTIFGYDSFRPLQTEVIDNALHGRDTLVVMPTGGGKSICYQIPALLFDGLTVVVSPLISLMQDQVQTLRALGAPAAYLNSTLDRRTYAQTMEHARSGALKLLYVAPETLLRDETLRLLGESNLRCLTIDEAHCVSQWGHDFRPEYRQIVSVRERFPEATCLALTATATPRVQADIRETLGFRSEDEFLASFDRPNLFVDVEPKRDYIGQALDFVQAHEGQSGIVYCSTRKGVDELYEVLRGRNVNARPYHAGLDAATRAKNQTDFIRDDVPIIVATVAFGMGIDKPDVRWVLHVNLPQDVESYYQQIGRAGRDGLRADCRLLYSYSDVRTISYFIDQGAANEAPGRRARLEAMVGWAEASQCRRIGLLRYFGEEYKGANPNDPDEVEGLCGMCDNCLAEPVEQVDLTVAAQKFLSCIVRTGERFGATHIIDVLRGSQAKKILSRGHQNLSTYGIGQDYSTQAWKELARQFIQQGLIEQDMQHGGLSLTEQGRAVLTSGESVLGQAPEVSVPSSTSGARPAESLDYDATLFQLLRQQRKALADEAEVPPYVVFADRSLMEMAAYFPQSRESFGAIYGVGAAKLNTYADEFLPLIRDYCEEHDIREEPRLASAASTASASSSSNGSSRGGDDLSPRTHTVGNALNQGMSLAELMESINVRPSTVFSHLEKYVRGGYELPAETLRAASTLDAAQQARVLDVYGEVGTEFLRPVHDALEGAVDWDDLKLMRLVYWIESEAMVE